MSAETERSKQQRRVQSELHRWTLADDIDGATFHAFVKAVLDRVRGPFLGEHPPRVVLRALQTAFEFLSQRAGHAPRAVVHPSPRGRGALLMTLVDDQPFLVDSVRLAVRRSGAEWWSGLNVVLPVVRDEQGLLVGFDEERGHRESLILVESSAGSLLDDVPATCRTLEQVLTLAQVTVRDFVPMVAVLKAAAEQAAARAEASTGDAFRWTETAEFVRWLLQDNFVFMGVVAASTTLGINTVPGAHCGTTEGAWPLPHPPGTVGVRKSSADAPIHRDGRLDEIRIDLSEAGDGSDAVWVRGLFTYKGVTQPLRNVPILRGVLQSVLQSQGAVKGTFRYKGIANVFDSLPTEQVFAAPASAIATMIEHVLDADTAEEVGVSVLRIRDGSMFVLVSMPRGAYAEDTRREVERDLVGTLQPTRFDTGLFVGRFETILLHYHLSGQADVTDAQLDALADRLRSLATPWASRLWDRLEALHDIDVAEERVEQWGRAFPDAYKRTTPVERAMKDVEILASLSAEDPVAADIFVDESERSVLRFYQYDDVAISQLLPVVDHFGISVRSSDAVEVQGPGHNYHIDSCYLEVDPAHAIQLNAHKERLLEALPAVLNGWVDDDLLNALVVTAGLTWQEVDVVRAFVRYQRQLHVSVSLPQMQAILLASPERVAALVALFNARFDPVCEGDRALRVAAADAHALDQLRSIHSNDQDVVFGGIYNLIHAVVRTNAFRDDRVRHYLSFKLEAAKVRDMKGARPMFETYVHAVDVEGVHLRFGRVARGGLRWSDRADFRTEVLALVSTQQIKNVVIVPEGAKGGFYVRTPARPEDRRAQADRLYAVFVRALLDLVDNQVDGQVVPPPQVVRHDADDPYLVVAADKGTAHLSDTANGLSAQYGFWLGDAFASGGSQGYDHKVVGITARGAWVLVRRHFAELGTDPMTEPFTCAGIGDLGGDVFGNGLLESKQTLLVAAFNHQHVFLDPTPDAARTWVERKRLFDLGGRAGGWDHYDTSLLSEGGGIFDRSARSIPLSSQVRALLGLDVPEAGPEEVVRAILRLDVDLLWSGGIGTYVKATHETHADVDDRSNDRFRVDATELRCRVVGEGANLSFTQAGRVEAALRGVRLNADFVDNSGGVDLSDHEVNLKILLQRPVARGELPEAERNALLAQMTDEVAELVLRDNDAQGRQISRDHVRAEEDVFPFGRAIAFVERAFTVSRASLGLPTDAELTQRAASGVGLTRPELAMLSAWVKRWVYSELAASGKERAIDPGHTLLRTYFPAAIQERFLADIDGHPLASEIAMTVATTRIVGDAGAAFLPLVVETTGRTVAEVAEAYLKAQGLARSAAVRTALEQQRATVGMRALSRAWVRMDRGCRSVVWYWLAPGGRAPNDDELAQMQAAVDEVMLLDAAEVHARNLASVAEMRADGIPEPVAQLVVRANYLDEALMAWWLSQRTGTSLRAAAITHIAALRASRLGEVLERLRARPASGRWEPIAAQVMANRIGRLARQQLLRIGVQEPADSVDRLEPFLREGMLAPVRAQVDMLLADGADLDVATLTVLEERLDGAIRRLKPHKTA